MTRASFFPCSFFLFILTINLLRKFPLAPTLTTDHVQDVCGVFVFGVGGGGRSGEGGGMGMGVTRGWGRWGSVERRRGWAGPGNAELVLTNER